MKKTTIWLISLLFLCANGAAFLLRHGGLPSFGKAPVVVAAVGPASGKGQKNGEDMIRGISLCMDRINRDGGIDGREVRLEARDDKNDERAALQVASRIANESRAVVVLGHLSSRPFSAAGEIYKGNGIPVITASATAESITFGNDWYFRTVPGDEDIRRFMAAYMDKEMGSPPVSIIFHKDEYSESLARGFGEEAAKLGMAIRGIWGFSTENNILYDMDVGRIISELRAMDAPGIIFLSANSSSGARFMSSLRYPGSAYMIVGSDAFSTPSFLDNCAMYPMERRLPGYYSDRVLSVAPFIPEISGKAALDFKREFEEKYGQGPSWIAASYHDAMLVAAEAIRKAEIHGQNMMKDRRMVRDALSRINRPDIAVRGVGGDIWFQDSGSAGPRPLSFGIWKDRKFLSGFTQYRTPPSAEGFRSSGNGEDGYPEEGRTDIVYTGMDITEIHLNPNLGAFAADFYLWFHFQGDFDDTRVVFPDAVAPPELGESIAEGGMRNISFRSYRVRAEFRSAFDFHAYPFDEHTLRIRLHHADIPADRLVYVPDVLSLPREMQRENIGATRINAISGWKIADISFHQGEANLRSPSGDTAVHSEIGADIRIKRESRGVIVKVFFPISAILVVLYLLYHIPADMLSVRLLIAAVMFLAAAVTHHVVFGNIPGMVLTGRVFFAIYALIGLSALMSLLIHGMHVRGAGGKERFFTLAGMFIAAATLSLVCAFVTYMYHAAN